MSDGLIERLAHCRTLEEFRDICEPLGLYGERRRFMQLELDITNRCNIRCVMCYHSFETTRRAPTVHLPVHDFAEVAASILPFAHRLSLSLGNEPLMSPYFVDVLRAAAPHRLPHFNFFTNGLLLNPSNIDAIIEFGVTQVCVSVDGATESTYNDIRREADFGQLIRNLALLVARRKAAGSRTPHVRFDVAMMARNIHELVAIVELAARIGVEAVAFRHLVVWEGLGMERESLRHTPALSNYWLDRALRRADDLGIEVAGHPAPFDLHSTDEPIENVVSATPAPYCPFPFFHVSMGPGCHVYPCPHAHGEEPYGQVSETMTFERIWLGDKFTTLRRRILAGDPPDMCRRCPFLADKYPDVAGFFAARSQQGTHHGKTADRPDRD